jgi:hypothetical protein
MGCHPASRESVQELRRLRDRAAERGDDCLATLLAGVDLYVSLGREIELLEVMRRFAHQVHGSVQNAPTAEDLKRLYDLESPGDPTPPG